MIASRSIFVFGLLALAALLCVTAHPSQDPAPATSNDKANKLDETQYFNNNNDDSSEEISDSEDSSTLSSSTTSTDSCGTINDVFLFTYDKTAAWCAYNDTMIVKLENNPTNRNLAPCQWRSTTCNGFTLIFQNVGTGNKFLACAITNSKTFCRKTFLLNPFNDRGQFFIKSTSVGLDTFKSNKYSANFLADNQGLVSLGTSASAFKMCKKNDFATC